MKKLLLIGVIGALAMACGGNGKKADDPAVVPPADSVAPADTPPADTPPADAPDEEDPSDE